MTRGEIYLVKKPTSAGEAEGLKHDSAVHCDGLISIAKSRLTDCRGSLGPQRPARVNAALAGALEIE